MGIMKGFINMKKIIVFMLLAILLVVGCSNIEVNVKQNTADAGSNMRVIDQLNIDNSTILYKVDDGSKFIYVVSGYHSESVAVAQK
jgi:uncharacterized membrane protein